MKYGLSFAASIAVVGVTLFAGPAHAYTSPQNARQKAAEYTRTSRELIAAGRLTDGVKLMRLAIQTNPLDPTLRMNYVKVMSKKGEQSLQSGNRNEAITVFRSVEVELLSAAKLYMDHGANDNAAYALTQVAQIYRHVYGNESKARGYFSKAYSLSPNSSQILALAQGR